MIFEKSLRGMKQWSYSQDLSIFLSIGTDFSPF